MPNGFSAVSSIPGKSASILLVLLTLAYGVLNVIELKNYGKSTIRLYTIDHYYSERDVFNLDKKPGLNIAFGITHYDANLEPIDDPDYGELVGEIKRWDGEIYIPHIRLKLRPCTREELGLDTGPEGDYENSIFYPPHDNSKRFIELYWKKLQCYDEEVEFRGNFNSESANNLIFFFVPCNNATRATCKTA